MGIIKVIDKHTDLPYEISPDYKRMDQMNTVPMRMGWDPEISASIDRFISQRMGETRRPNEPGFTDLDVALAMGAWCLETEAGGNMSGAGVGNQAFYSWDGEIFPRRTEFKDLDQASKAIKQIAKFMGADLVGIADYDERWIYSHSYHPITKVHELIVFPFEPKSVIVMAVEMDIDAIHTATSYISSAAIGEAYGQMAVTAHRVAVSLRALGYHAAPCGNDTGMSVPLAIQAGLGELSRIGILITPEYGPRVRLCKVFTDLPLQADQPITFGVQEFCKTCMKCADACPVHVISKNREPSFETVSKSNNPGVKKWYNKVDNCFKYWAKVDCTACVSACTYNKKNDWVHQLGLRIAQTPAKGLLRKLDDLLGYGKTFDKEAMLKWWSTIEATDAQGTNVNEETAKQTALSVETGLEAINEKTSPEEVFAILSDKFKQHPEKLKGASNAVIQFNVSGDTGGFWFISVANGQAEVGIGENPTPNLTITMKDKDLPLLVSGKLNPPSALMAGKISIRGDMSHALKIKKLFS